MSTHIYKTVKEILANPEQFEQCNNCGNPVDKRHINDGCSTCGNHEWTKEEEKDFSALDILHKNEEFEV